MKYKAIIFDMDGTIIDTEKIWQQATKKLIESKKVPLSSSQETDLQCQLPGLSLPDSCFLIKQVMRLEDEVQDLMREKMHIANQMYATGISFIEGFLTFHSEAKKQQLKMAVATNADHETVKIADASLNLSALFDAHLYNRSHVAQPKPHPALYIHAAEKIEIDPSQCIAIEDSAPGIAAAKGAGMFCIGINTAKKIENLKDADLIIQGYHEIDLNHFKKNRS